MVRAHATQNGHSFVHAAQLAAADGMMCLSARLARGSDLHGPTGVPTAVEGIRPNNGIAGEVGEIAGSAVA